MIAHPQISINADIRFGKPCVKGTRIAIFEVFEWLAKGMSRTEIIADFPDLTEEKINACLAYAADRNRRLK
jgi:uncharacterized protein (DUF433 family)